MMSRAVQWLGVVLIGVLLAVGYLRNRDADHSLLASVVGGYESSVSYTLDDASIIIAGDEGGQSSLSVVLLYDPDRVMLDGIQTDYQYVVEDDGMGIVRLLLESLPARWTSTTLAEVVRSGAIESVVVSDVGFDDEQGRFHTLPVSNNSLCIGNECGHEHDA